MSVHIWHNSVGPLLPLDPLKNSVSWCLSQVADKAKCLLRMVQSLILCLLRVGRDGSAQEGGEEVLTAQLSSASSSSCHPFHPKAKSTWGVGVGVSATCNFKSCQKWQQVTPESNQTRDRTSLRTTGARLKLGCCLLSVF